MHHVYRDAPWDEIWQAYEILVQQGKGVYAGSSNFAGWHIVQANENAKQRHFLGLVSAQSKYSLIQREVELEVLPSSLKFGVGVIPWSPLGGGLLGGVLDGPTEGRRSGLSKEIEARRPQLERWEALAKELGEKPADVALAWLLKNPAVTGPIIGPRTNEQLDGSLRALDIVLSEETLKTIDEIWPGPRKPAPEAYAW